MVYYAPQSRESEIISGRLTSSKANKGKLKIRSEKLAAAKKMSDKEDEPVAKKQLFKPKKRNMKKAFIIAVVLVAIGGFLAFYKTSNLFSKISVSGGSIFGGLFKDKDDLAGMDEGQINVLLIGMRGQNIPGGSLLADTIMVVSFRPKENKVAMISIPRDLYVQIPGKNYARKINEANPIGEEEGRGKGLKLMEETVSNVTGMDIHYAVSANFDAMRDTVDILGGITVHLDKPFYEGKQFVEGNECGGEFSLPAGEVTLSGEKALCYSRARFSTSDFDRARRQQEVLIAIKDKALSLGTLSDYSKVTGLMDVMGNNILTDMEPWVMQKLFETFQGLQNPTIYRKVFDTTEDGLLVSGNNGSYILVPAAGENNYSEIQAACNNVFND